MSIASRLPGVMLLAIVLVAAALLIAGYGAAVGVGVIVGLTLGGAVVVAVVAMSRRSGGGATFSTLTSDRTLTSDGSLDQSVQSLMERHGHASMRVAAVDQGRLHRVIAAGTAAEAGGALVELVAIEIREDGGIVTLVVHVRPPLGDVGHFLEVTVKDDVRTAYVASGQASGGSMPGIARQEIRFSPAPPEAAQMLTVRIERFFDPFRSGSEPIVGPWEFRVAL